MAAAAAAAAEPEDVEMEELEHEIEAAAAAEAPEEAEDELAGEPEQENTGKRPSSPYWPSFCTVLHNIMRIILHKI